MPAVASPPAPEVLTSAARAAVGSAPRVERAPAQGGPATIQARGRWTVLGLSAPPDWKALADSLARVPAQADTAWDLQGIEQLDHIGAQVLWRHWGAAWPAQLAASEAQRALLAQVAQFTAPAPQTPPLGLVGRFKRFANHGPHMLAVARDFVQLIGQLALDVLQLLRAPHRGPWRDFSGHLYNTGATAMPITALVGLLIGVVLAYLMSNQLRQYGGETFIVNILGLSLIRELGPVLAAVLIAGRSGSAITAQIGVMRVTDELDAMRVMGIAHGFRLVMPRVLALAIVMPLISVWTSVAALAGGMLAANVTLDMSPAYFMQALPAAVPVANLWLAMAKSAVFGILIALVACYHGMRIEPNTESLGRGTTNAVVISITVVIVVDAVFAVLFKGVGFGG